MTRILIVSTDIVGSAMAGPGIRALELARTLAHSHQVTLAVPDGSTIHSTECTIVCYDPHRSGTLAPLLNHVDVVVGQGFVFATHPELLQSDLPLAIDLYDPLILESLDLYATADLAVARERHQHYQTLTENLLRRGDFFFCATETQRDYWLGALAMAGRIAPDLARQADRELRTLIDCVPSGIPALPPVSDKPRLRNVHPAIGQDALVLLWAGGLWDWFDPMIIIRAVAALHSDMPQLRLCFFAGARPNHLGEPFRTRTFERARVLATELGVLDRSVIFLEEWIPYTERGAYLLEADVGVSAHLPGIETRFAFRTRLLDYLWARLPVICTDGDSLGREMAHTGAGLLVPPHDLAGWIAALQRIGHDSALRTACAAAADQLASRYHWVEVARPLTTFCADPHRLPGPATPPVPTQRIAELEQALAERERYVRHVEHQYELAVRQAAQTHPLSQLRAWLHRWRNQSKPQ